MCLVLLIVMALFLTGCLTRWGYQATGNNGLRLAGGGLLIVVILLPALSVAAGPTDQVRATVDKVLVIVKNSSLKSPAQKKDLQARLAEIIYPRFDFTEMAKRSLGPHWGRRTPEEQREFVKLFAELLGKSYADRIESYTSQNVLYTREVEDKNYAEVDTTIVSDKQEKVSINYKLHSVDKEWRVYDLVIEDISVINNYRSQFNRVIARSSFEELVRMLKEKQS
jgi:phospholipid transport system substrate-binding protein